MKKAFLFLAFLLSFKSTAQVTIHTTDIDNYWIAYDSIVKTHDFSARIGLINRLYIQKGTPGLHQFMWARQYNDTLYVKLMESYPKFWTSLRPNMAMVKDKQNEIVAAAKRFKELYPPLKPADIYFTIGSFRSGGTIRDNLIMIGCEIAAGMPDSDISEFPTQRLALVFRQQTPAHIVSLVIHEYVHTLQRGNWGNVLASSIREGSCDFITELVLGRTLETSYLTYGRAHAAEVKERFGREMFAKNWNRWLYNTAAFDEGGDMGYYIGYEICKAYYNNSKDKAKAIKEIIRLNYSNEKAVEQFLEKSGYYPAPIDKEKVIKAYNEALPYIVSMDPALDGRTDVDSGITEFRITFSQPMDPENWSVYYTKKGKDYFPFEKVGSMENDNKTFVFKTNIYAGKEYEFIISDDEFSTPDGFKMRNKSFKVHFKTRDFLWPEHISPK
jgi:hypothetical protein